MSNIPTPDQFYAQQAVENRLAFAAVTATVDPPTSTSTIWEWAVILDGAEHTWQTRLRPADLDAADAAYLDYSGFHDRYDAETAVEVGDAAAAYFQWTQYRNVVSLDSTPAAVDLTCGPAPTPPLPVETPLHPIDLSSAAVTWLITHGRALPIPWTLDDLVTYLDIDIDDRYSAIGRARWARAVWALISRP